MPYRKLAVEANLVQRERDRESRCTSSRSGCRRVPGEPFVAPSACRVAVGFAGRLSQRPSASSQCVPASGEALHACVCMSHNADDGAQQQQSYSELYAALARTATRSLALYFSRPVRLFRPSKGAQPSPAQVEHGS